MTTAKGRLEVSPPEPGGGAEKLDEAARCFTRSLIVTGISLAMIPVNMLPDEPRHHLRAAGRELARALASLSRTAADTLEKWSHESEGRRE